MMDHVCQNFSGVFLVITHLGTSIWMLECNDIFYISAYKLLCSSLKSLCNRVYTANSWNDPDLITDTDFSVCSAVAVKVYMLRWLYILTSFWPIFIRENIA